MCALLNQSLVYMQTCRIFLLLFFNPDVTQGTVIRARSLEEGLCGEGRGVAVVYVTDQTIERIYAAARGQGGPVVESTVADTPWTLCKYTLDCDL